MKNIFCVSIALSIAFINCPQQSSAQGISETYALAEKQFAEGNYNYAHQLADRVLFFDSEDKYSAGSELIIARCLFREKEYDKAAVYFENAFNRLSGDSAKTECLFDKASCYLLTKQYNYALNELLAICENKSQPDFIKRKYLYLGVTYYYLNDFEASKIYLNRFEWEDPQVDSSEIEKLYSENNRISKRYRPKLARIMSLIIPGSGQIYSGDYKNGINSILLVALFGYLGYTVVVNATLGDAVITVMPWLQRYYYGGSQKAESICRDKLQYERNKLMEKFLRKITL